MTKEVRVQTSLDLERTTPDAEVSVSGVVEPFEFDGKEFVAHIAPCFGVQLRVKPVENDTRNRDTAIAYHAFLQRYRARIELICHQTWGFQQDA